MELRDSLGPGPAVNESSRVVARVLLVDDHALIRRGMRDALADEGVQVVGEAACWDELDPLLGAQPCDVLLLDIQLPGPSGLEILERLAGRAGAASPAADQADADGVAVPGVRKRCREKRAGGGGGGGLDEVAAGDVVGHRGLLVSPSVASRR